MKCPFCNQDNTRVVDSRPVEDTNSMPGDDTCEHLLVLPDYIIV